MSTESIFMVLRGGSESDLLSYLQNEVGSAFFSENERAPLDLVMRIYDLSQEVEYAETFLSENDTVGGSWLDSSDGRGFNVYLSLHYLSDSLVSTFVFHFIDRLAFRISRDLCADTAVFFNQNLPFRVYSSGKCISDFSEENKFLLEGSSWPN
jgi:hypothetical protein